MIIWQVHAYIHINIVRGGGRGISLFARGFGLVSMPILGGNFYTKYMYVN